MLYLNIISLKVLLVSEMLKLKFEVYEQFIWLSGEKSVVEFTAILIFIMHFMAKLHKKN